MTSDISTELTKRSEDMDLTVISRWLRAAYPAGESMIGDVARRLLELSRGRDFYMARYREFDKLARTLPEPYKTQAFDILANGKIAPWNETRQEAQP